MLLLRLMLGATTILRGAVQIWDGENPAVGSRIIGTIALVVGVSLLAGFLTPLNALIVFLAGFAATISLISAGNSAVEIIFLAVYVSVTALAAALLGPGAYSLDARLFGRREIIIPEK